MPPSRVASARDRGGVTRPDSFVKIHKPAAMVITSWPQVDEEDEIIEEIALPSRATKVAPHGRWPIALCLRATQSVIHFS